jgi:hypothetical protein
MEYEVELEESGVTITPIEATQDDAWNFRILFVSLFSALGGFLFGYVCLIAHFLLFPVV